MLWLKNSFIYLSGKYQGLTIWTNKRNISFSPSSFKLYAQDRILDQTLQLPGRLWYNVVGACGNITVFLLSMKLYLRLQSTLCHEDHIGYFENQINIIRNPPFSLARPEINPPLSEHLRPCFSNASRYFFWNLWGALAVQIPAFFTVLQGLPMSFTLHPSPSSSPLIGGVTSKSIISHCCCAEFFVLKTGRCQKFRKYCFSWTLGKSSIDFMGVSWVGHS